MGNRKQTSVVFNNSVQKIKDELAPVYGLKNILSGGLLLFYFLPPDKREELLTIVNSTNAPADSDSDGDMIRRKIIQILRASQKLGARKKAARAASSAKSG